jgi:hypothetical protein
MAESFENSIYTTAELFGDAAIDLVRNRQLIWVQDKVGNFARMFKHEGTTYLPAALDPSLEARLPFESDDYGSTEDLVQAMSGSAREMLGASDNYAVMLAIASLSAWVPECLLGGAPILNLWGPADKRATALAYVLALWRRPLQLLDPSIEALAELPRHFRPTVVVNDISTASLARLSLAVGQNGAGMLRRGRLVKARCSLVVFTALPSSLTRFRIPLSAFAPIRSLTPRDAAELRKQFEGKLLRYRLARHQAIAKSPFGIGGFAPGVTRLADQLGAAVAGATPLQLALEQALQELDEEEKFERCQSEEAVAVEAILLPCHEQRPSALIGELSEIANTILIERGERALFTPKKYGATVRRLSLPAKRQAAGFELTLDASTCRRVHELGRMLGVLALSKPFEGCSYCASLFATDSGSSNT